MIISEECVFMGMLEVWVKIREIVLGCRGRVVVGLVGVFGVDGICDYK